MKQKNKTTFRIFFISGIASVVYASWVVGYFTNTKVALLGTASELSAADQADRLLFVVGDVIVSLIVVILAAYMFNRSTSKTKKWASFLFGLFAIATLATTFTPLTCSETISVCRSGINETRQLAHNVLGSIAAVSIGLSAILTSRLLTKPSLLVFQVSLLIWACFGAFSMLHDINVSDNFEMITALTQRIFLLGSSLLIALIPVLLHISTIKPLIKNPQNRKKQIVN